MCSTNEFDNHSSKTFSNTRIPNGNVFLYTSAIIGVNIDLVNSKLKTKLNCVLSLYYKFLNILVSLTFLHYIHWMLDVYRLIFHFLIHTLFCIS